MQIEIRLDETAREPKVIIVSDKMTDEVSEIVKKLSSEDPKVIAGFCDDVAVPLELCDIVRIYASDGKVLAEANGKEYVLRQRLYELESRLCGAPFARISNSEIINLKKVSGFDLSFSGTIYVRMTNGAVTYVSRRYVAKIKQVLGI